MFSDGKSDQLELVRSLTSYLRRKSSSYSICTIIDHCSNCGDVLAFTRGLTLALGSDVANKFGRRLFDAFLCKESGVVDCNFIVVMYKSLAYTTLAFRNPRSLFLKILEEYTLNGDIRCEHKKLDDILKIVSIAAVTKDEWDQTSGSLNGQLTNMCREQISLVTNVELEKALNLSPSVMERFRLQLVNQMHSSEKLELLCALENESLCAFIEASKKIGVKRIHAFKLRRLFRCFDAWRTEVEYSQRLRKRIKKSSLSIWKKEAHLLKRLKMLKERSLLSFSAALTRRNFSKWRHLVLIKNRIQRVCLSEDIDKEVRAASGHLRIVSKKVKLRLAFVIWINFTLTERRFEHAKLWHERKTEMLSFHSLRQYSSREICKRKSIRETSIIQKRNSQRQSKSRDLERRTVTRSKWTSKQALRSSNQVKPKTRQPSQRDMEILATQRDLRRKRVSLIKHEMKKAFSSKWLKKQSEFEAQAARHIQAWMATADYKLLFEEQEKKYKSILSDSIDEDAECALTSDEVISYSILDGLMAVALVDCETLFDAVPDPFNFVAFERALKGVNFLDTAQAHGIFRAMSGESNFDANTTITKGRLRELQRISHQYIGAEGSPWKIYVCSRSSKILFHNISSGQKIVSIKKKHIHQAIRENILACEMFKVRRTFLKKQQQAHRSMWEKHAAKTIQFMFRLWKGRRLIKRQMWVVDRLRLKTEKKEARAVRVIQDAFRRKGFLTDLKRG